MNENILHFLMEFLTMPKGFSSLIENENDLIVYQGLTSRNIKSLLTFYGPGHSETVFRSWIIPARNLQRTLPSFQIKLSY